MKKLQYNFYKLKNTFANQKGVVLVTVVLLLLVLGLLILVAAKWSATDIKRTKNYTKSRQAFYVAETGLQMAMNYLNFAGVSAIDGGSATDGFDLELADGDGSSWGTDWPAATFQNVNYNGGKYTVTLTDNDDGDGDDYADLDNTVIITSKGFKRGKWSTIEAIVYRGEFGTTKGFLTDDDVTMAGDYTINGDVHSNEGMVNNGSTGVITGDATATYPPCTNPCTDVDGTEFIPLITHEMFETLFRPLADVILLEGSPAKFLWRGSDLWDLFTSTLLTDQDVTYEKITTQIWDGAYVMQDVTDPITGVVTQEPTTTKIMINYTCWKPLTDNSATRCNGSDPTDPDKTNTAGDTQQQYYLDVEDNFGNVNRTGSNVWKFNGDKLPQNVYIYVEIKDATYGGKITINNTPSPEWVVSIISTGAIDMQAGAVLDNYLKPGLPQGEQDLFLMAGTDIELAGSASLGSATEAVEGFMYARDQVDLGGTVYLEGTVLARDDEESPTNEFDGLISENKVSGNFTLSYNGNIDFPFPGPVQILSWREVEVIS